MRRSRKICLRFNVILCALPLREVISIMHQNVARNVGYNMGCFACIYLITLMSTTAFIEVTAKQFLQK